MRKIKILIFFMILFTFNINNVKAVNVSYDITSMKVTSGSIYFEGWAIAIGYNNYGGHTSDIDMYAQGSNGNTLDGTAKLINLGYATNNFYPIHCINHSSCTKSNGCAGNGLCKLERNSSCGVGDCIYRNVYFSASFKISDLIELGNDVKFYIKVSYDSSNKNVPNSTVLGYGQKSSFESSATSPAIGVYQMNCKIDGQQCVEGSNAITVGDEVIEMNISSISNSGKVIEDAVAIQRNKGNNVFEKISDSCRLHTNEVVSLSNPTMMQYTYAHLFEDSLLQVIGYKSNKLCAGYLYGTWLIVDRSLVLNFDKEAEPKICKKNEHLNLKCENGSFESSCNYDIIGDAVSISYPSTSTDNNCSSSKEYKVTGSVKLTQQGDLTFYLDRGPVYSGGGFTFKIDYKNTVYWEYNGSVETSYSTEESPTTTNKCPYFVAPESCTLKKNKDGEYCDCSSSQRVYYSSSCSSYDSYEKIISKEVKKKYNGVDSSELKAYAPNSNVVSNNKELMPGSWECNSATISDVWKSGKSNLLTSYCSYTMDDAFINKKTSEVVYGFHGGSLYLNGNSSSNEPMYYIPLKWPTGVFGINVNYKNLSSLSDMNWYGTYECDVECQQKFYDIPNGGYLYYFRPISLSEPFPNGREIGINWVDWIADRENQERLLETYTTDNNLEYTVILSSSDIANIKKYNYNANYSGGKGYLDLEVGNNFDVNGNSSFIKTYNYFTLGNVNHSGLGVFDPEDDMQ